MEEKVDSEQSYSGESSSSSTDSSSGTSDSDEEVLESVRILGQNLELPQELCEDPDIFKEFFSMKTWECLEEEDKEHLKQFLPDFPDDDDDEKEATVKMLLEYEPFYFTSPLQSFHKNLRQGNFRPDIAKMRRFLRKARAKQQKHKRKAYYAKLLPEVLLSRERVLAGAKSAPPGPPPYIPPLPPKPSVKSNLKPIYLRARQRYFEELGAIWSEVGGEESEDDNYPEGPPELPYRKRKQANSVQNTDSSVSGTLGSGEPSHLKSLECLKNVLAIHRARRQYRENHPELNIAGITLEDIKQRVALINGTKKLMFGGPKTETPIQKLKKGTKRELYSKQTKPDMKGGKKGKEDVESVDTKPLLPNIKIKCEQEESDSESSSFLDPVTSPKHCKKLPDNIEIKKEVDVNYSNISNMNYSETNLETIIKQEPPDPTNHISNSGKNSQPVPIKLEDLDGIDMMALPVELIDDTGEVVAGDTSAETAEESAGAASGAGSGASAGAGATASDEPLTETTHANFLSLVRALFPARAAHRASKQQLRARCAAVMSSPIAPLNTWYSLSNDWCAELDSALDFLAGERGPHPDDYVPYLQYMPENQMYQWIGAGRDCDALLGRLCERWVRAAAPHARDCADRTDRTDSIDRTDHSDRTGHTDRTDRTDWPEREEPAALVRQTPSWGVRPPTTSEMADFRAQERKRFSTATKPFTYTQHGVRSTVGPATGAGAGVGGSAGGAAAGGALLAAHRPRAATFPTLVRDALARLPRGEGSRRDILTLLRMSQWILPCSDQTLSSALLLTLDKMLSAKRDPIVKFDIKTSLWTYLHKNRSEEDWLKCTKRGKASVASRPLQSPPEPMEVEVASVEEVSAADANGSDSDVDVDDCGTPPPGAQLSCAQLLMRATAQPPPPPPSRPRARPPATPRPRPARPAAAAAQPAKPATAVQSARAAAAAQPAKQAPAAATAKRASPKRPAAGPAPKPAASRQLGDAAPAGAGPGPPPQKSVAKQEPAQPPATVVQPAATSAASHIVSPAVSVMHPTVAAQPAQPKLTQVTRSLLIKPSAVQTTSASVAATAVVCTTPATQTSATTSIRRGVVRVLSPATPSSGKSLISPRALMQPTCTTATAKKRQIVPTTASVTTVAQSSASTTTVASSQATVATVQLAGGRTVQALHLAAGHALQLAGGVRLPAGHTVQLAAPPRPPAAHLAGQTVQIAGQTVQLTGHTVKLPGGRSVQVAGPSTAPPRPSAASVPAVQTVQIAGQTVQLTGQAVQTLQLAGGQTVQLPNGQTIQLASGQALQLANQPPKSIAQVVRAQSTGDKTTQPIVAKLLTNAQLQGQMISLEGVVGARARGAVRVVSPAARLARPLLLTAAKPLHNIILQQSDGSAIRVTSSGGASTSPTIVLSNIGGQTATTSTSSAPILKLQQAVTNSTVPTSSGVRSVLMDGQQLKLVGGRHVLARLLKPAHPPP